LRYFNLSRRELQVLELLAQGYSNAAICRQFWLTTKTVETHIRSIYAKLDLPADDEVNRRVKAVLMYQEAMANPVISGWPVAVV
jgi:ATP/maltotriose-dependent transcriptional regulator MalT